MKEFIRIYEDGGITRVEGCAVPCKGGSVIIKIMPWGSRSIGGPYIIGNDTEGQFYYKATKKYPNYIMTQEEVDKFHGN